MRWLWESFKLSCKLCKWQAEAEMEPGAAATPSSFKRHSVRFLRCTCTSRSRQSGSHAHSYASLSSKVRQRRGKLIRCAYLSDQSFHFLHHKIYQTRATSTTTTCAASVLAATLPAPSLSACPLPRTALSFALSLRFL